MSISDISPRFGRIAANIVGLSGYCLAFYLAQQLHWEGDLLQGGALGLLAFLSWMLPQILKISGGSSTFGDFGTYDDNFWVVSALAVAVGSGFFWFFDGISSPLAAGFFLALLGGFSVTPLIGKRFAS